MSDINNLKQSRTKQNVPMSNNGGAASDIEEKLSNLSVEKPSYPSEMFKKERASFKLNKSSRGKLQKDRRKMREKRRSTGVVYLGCQGNDSNGTTTAEEEEEDEVVEEDEETVKNTKQNEISTTSSSSTGGTTEEGVEGQSKPGLKSNNQRYKIITASQLGYQELKDNYRNLLDLLRQQDEQILCLETDFKKVKDENKKLLEENSALLRAIRKIS